TGSLVVWPGFVRNRSGGDLFDRLVRFGETERDEEPDDRPGRIEFARAEAELRAARISVMVVVQAFAAGQERDEADVGRRVVEVAVADVVAETVDRRRQDEDVHDRMDAGGEQAPPETEHDAETDRADRQAEQPAVEHVLVPPALFDVPRVA